MHERVNLYISSVALQGLLVAVIFCFCNAEVKQNSPVCYRDNINNVKQLLSLKGGTYNVSVKLLLTRVK